MALFAVLPDDVRMLSWKYWIEEIESDPISLDTELA